MFNIRKIASGIASLLMVGSSVALGAATSYPQPFDGGDVAIVTGTWTGAADSAAATAIIDHLTPLIRTTGGSTTATGDTLKLEKGSNFFNLGEQMDDFYSTIDEDELPSALAKGEYLSDDNEDYEYEQQLVLGANTLTHFQDSDFNNDEPILGFDLSSGALIMNYTLDFTPDNAACGSGFNNCETTEFPLMGKNYFVSSIAESTTGGWKITLLDSAVESTLTEGDTVTLTLNGVDYDITTVFMDDDQVSFSVNGANTNKLNEGDTQKVGGGSAYIGVKSINDVSGYQSTGNVIFSLGSGKLVLEHTQEVLLNDDTISEVTDKHVVKSYTKNSTATTLDSLTLQWTLEDDVWITEGNPLEYPVFKTFALSYDGLNFPVEEVTSLDTRGDDSITLNTGIKEGPVSFDLLYTNNASTFGEWHGLGEKSTHKLVTSGTSGSSSTAVTLALNETENSYFVATWISGSSGTGDDGESYVFEIGTITSESGKNKTTLTNQVSGGSDITFTEVGDTETIGEIDFKLTAANDNLGTATVNFTSSTSGLVYADRLVTKEGLRMRLPVDSVSVGDGNLNLTSPIETAWTMNFTEEDDNDNKGLGKSFTVTLGFDTDDGAEVTGTSVTDYETADGSDKYEGYVAGSLASKTLFDDPSGALGNMDITYHGSEVKADVFLSQGVTGGGSTTVMSITDNEAATTGAGKNLIVVGGTCVNKEAARLLTSGSQACGAAWTSATGAAANEYIIQTFSRSGKIATIVAGWEATDTRNAATYLTTQKPSVNAGDKWKGSESDSATLVSG